MLPLLLCLPWLATPFQQPAWNQPAKTTLSVLVEGPSGAPLPKKRGATLRASVEARDDLGWPLEQTLFFSPGGGLQERGGPWRDAAVPAGSEVSLVAFDPDCGLREEIVRVGEEPRKIRLRMGTSQPLAEVRIQLLGKPEPEPRVDIGDLWIRGPRTGLVFMRTRRLVGDYEVSLPVGNYLLEWRGVLAGGCGNMPPFAETGVPIQNRLRALAGENQLLLVHQPWSRIELHVTPSGDRRRAWDTTRFDDAYYRFQEPATFPRTGFARAKLVQGGREVILEWGWKGLHYREARHEFPIGHPAQQMVPVESGEYQLVIAGLDIQEIRLPVSLRPGLQAVAVQAQPRQGK